MTPQNCQNDKNALRISKITQTLENDQNAAKNNNNCENFNMTKIPLKSQK